MKLLDVVFLMLLVFPTLAEETHNTENAAANSARPQADIKLSERASKFIAEHFSRPLEIVTEKYGKPMPEAMEKSKKGDHSQIVPMISDLAGTIGGKQVITLIKDADKLKSEELKKDNKERDDRFVELMDRFVVAGLNRGTDLKDIPQEDQDRMKTENKNEKSEAFANEFTKAFKTTALKNEEKLEKLKQAGEGNKEAIDWVQKNLDQKSLLSWADGQKKAGNGEAAELVVNAVAKKEGANKVMYMNQGADKIKFNLGATPESLTKGLEALFATKGGFGNAIVSYNPIKDVNKTYDIDADGKLGEKVVLTPTPTPQINPPTTPPNSPPEGSRLTDADFKEFQAFSTTKCQGCHPLEITGANFSALKIKRAGNRYTKVFDGLAGLKGILAKADDMGLDADTVTQLSKWANSK